MMWARVIPLIILLILAIIIVVLVLLVYRSSENIKRRERLAAEKRWTGDCQFDNPKTGAKCERQDFHLENHYHVLPSGQLDMWP